METLKISKGFITDLHNNPLLPITRGELVLDENGNIAFQSEQFLAKDGKPGLITSAERDMISRIGGSGNLSLTDVYNKLDYINTGLKVGNNLLNFFKGIDTITLSPIIILSDQDGTIGLNVSDDLKVTIGLAPLSNDSTEISNSILRSISVDKYGRVTEVTGSNLVNSDLPESLENKILKGATTADKDIADNELAVVNKAYVDAKVGSMSGVVTGALVFGGSLSTYNLALSVLNNEDYYYKVTSSFGIPGDKIYTGTGTSHDGTITVKIGDTLIIKDSKFVHVPSGDEKETLISILHNDTTLLDKQTGNVTFKFDTPFDVISTGNGITGYTTTISIPKVSAPAGDSLVGTDGYLSWEDYVAFKSYSSQLSTIYSPTIEQSTPNSYEIGTITIAGIDNKLYGVTSSLILESKTDNSITYPVFKFTLTGNNDLYYGFLGSKGINITKVNDNIVFTSTYSVDENSSKYLSIGTDDAFKINIGSISLSDTGEYVIKGGLTDFEEFNNFRLQVINSTTAFIFINNDLSDSTKEYHYGSDSLKAAINI